jgi:putative hydrolase of the HAD superfamily
MATFYTNLSFRKLKYKHIYFDLDRTLWDYEKNAGEALEDVYNLHGLERIIPGLPEFVENYKRNNELLWIAYRMGNIKKTELRVTRFYNTLKQFGIKNRDLAAKLDKDYIARSPWKTNLFPGTRETLQYLSGKYSLYILTNGFAEVQYIKMNESGLAPYFLKMFTSDEAGYQKPHAGIFEHAVKSVNAKKKECLMVGDDLVADIQGAQGFGMDQVFFNPNGTAHGKNPTYEIKQLEELRDIL